VVNLKKFQAKPNKTIQEHNDELLESLNSLKILGYVADDIYNLLEITCKYHDYGKINDEFQKRVNSKKYLKFDNNKEVAHNVLSVCFVEREEFKTEEDYLKVCYAILNHHHNTDNYAEIDDKEYLIKDFVKKFDVNRIRRSLKNRMIRMKGNPEAS